MQVVLIGKQKIYRVKLPTNAIGNYWITDGNEKLINIEANNGKWQIISNDLAQIIKSNYLQLIDDELVVHLTEESVAKGVILRENEMYAVCLKDSNAVYILHCLLEDENDFQHMDVINTNEYKVGNGQENDIRYKNSFASSEHARIFKKDEKWYIENYDKKYGTFVNDECVYNNIRKLENGDVIFIMGLKIIIINNSIYINNPHNSVELNNPKFALSKIKNKEINNTEKEEIILKQNINYYSRAPRIMNLLKTQELKIEEPPGIQNQQEKPMILTIATSLAMGTVSILYTISTVKNRLAGNMGLGGLLFNILIIILTFSAMIIIPIINIKYSKNAKLNYEKKRQQRYREYLQKKFNVISKIKEKQKKSLYKNYLSAKECAELIYDDNNHRLWERRIQDKDFLEVRIGIGDVPLNLKINCPEEKFAMEDDNLLDELHEMIDNSMSIKDAPIITSLYENNIAGIISNNDNTISDFVKNIILQLVTFHGYDHLKLVFLLKNNTSKNWEYVKKTPHIWDDTKQTRFFASDEKELNEILKFLGEKLRIRCENEKDEEENNKLPYYLIITDDYEHIENFSFIRELLQKKENYGFGLLCVSNDIFSQPNECKIFIQLDESEGTIFERENSVESQKQLKIETHKNLPIERMMQKLSNINLRINNRNSATLPNNYNFLEMYDATNIEQLNIRQRWKENDSTLSLSAPIGIDNNKMLISLDVHEKAHGPHGIIAGSTGSGKSELIITYLLSLAANYHPDDLTFLIIDYKGGGVAGAFTQKDFKLPHLVGTITNIDTHGLQRTLVSIKSELKRRQIIFNQARTMTGEGTIDIYKYQKLYHDGVLKTPLPHLLIVCDEFAELKQQQPEFMDELISVSRIGRSLGIHLILATQKPAGIVNDQIRSNSKFAICLKVQDKSDSMDMINKADAAYLKGTGQFYMQVGNDEYFVLGQSAWSGAQYNPSRKTVQNVDNSVEFISNIGVPIKKVDDVIQQNNNKNEEQLTSIVKYISNLAKSENIKTENLWLDNVPEEIYLNELRKKYNVKKAKNTIEAVLGEYDDPSNQKQGLVKIDFTKKYNSIIYGNAKSGKETFLSTMIFDLITTYDSKQVQLYVLDYGTEALKIYKNSPHVGDVIFASEEEKTNRFFEMLTQEINTRKDILSNYNGDYDTYISKGNIMPIIIVIMNNYETFEEISKAKYDDSLLMLTREGLKCGINFVITSGATNGMRYRMKQNFSKKIALQLNSAEEYLYVFDSIGKRSVDSIFGRGLICIENEKIVEFQTAKICNTIDYNDVIEKTIEELNKTNTFKAASILTMPDVLDLEQVRDKLTDISNVPLGISKNDLSVYSYDFKKNFMTVIASKNMKNAIEFSSYIVEELNTLSNVKTLLLDPDMLNEEKDGDLKTLFNEFKLQIEENNKKDDFSLCTIIGIDRFITSRAIEANEFYQLLKDAERSGKCSFIIIDNPSRLKSHMIEKWYSEYITGDTGIWIGGGITEQGLISVNLGIFAPENKIDSTFGLIVKGSKPIIIKLIGMTKE